MKRSLHAVVPHCFALSSCFGAEFGFAVTASHSSNWNLMGIYPCRFLDSVVVFRQSDLAACMGAYLFCLLNVLSV